MLYFRETDVEQLQQKVKALRNKMEWAQEDLAREIDVSLSTVQRLKPQRCVVLTAWRGLKTKPFENHQLLGDSLQ